jgi:hypothetical protein
MISRGSAGKKRISEGTELATALTVVVTRRERSSTFSSSSKPEAPAKDPRQSVASRPSLALQAFMQRLVGQRHLKRHTSTKRKLVCALRRLTRLRVVLVFPAVEVKVALSNSSPRNARPQRFDVFAACPDR